MAEEAIQKEPTMEEILASIRKIISEDDTPKPGSAANADSALRMKAEDVAVGGFNDEDDVTADTGLDTEPELEEEPLSFEDLIGEIGGDTATPQEDDPNLEDTDGFEIEPFEEPAFEAEPFEIEDAFKSLVSEDPEPTPADHALSADALEGQDVPAETVEPTEPSQADEQDVNPHPVAQPETPSVSVHHAPSEAPAMTQTARQIALTEEKTADAAAGALARLVAKMDMGSENTLEGIVRELLKPMIKVWLDENLPQIVEEKVEAEVQRIARLAR